eukprot:GFKZ01002870.1.p1 GENE.GFKZ01002870.1~~GFKZ01002870.1.p1  ORF type:complete len:232 (+),score=13.27 GFKZ01002870.1:79-696(+)
MSILLRNCQTKIPVDCNLLKRQAEQIRALLRNGRFRDHDVAINLTTNKHLTILNARYALIRSPTDVLSFRHSHSTLSPEFRNLQNAPYFDPRSGQLLKSSPYHSQLSELSRYLGTMFLSVEYCQRMARKRGMYTQDYLLLATVHGMAHLAGYVHGTPTSYKRMKQVEQHVLGVVRQQMSAEEDAEFTDVSDNAHLKRYLPQSYLA